MQETVNGPASQPTGLRKQSGYNTRSVTQHIQKKTTGYQLDLFIDKCQVAFNLTSENVPDKVY